MYWNLRDKIDELLDEMTENMEEMDCMSVAWLKGVFALAVDDMVEDGTIPTEEGFLIYIEDDDDEAPPEATLATGSP